MQLSALFQRVRGPMLSSLIVMSGYLLSRVTGLLREMVISAQFGTIAQLGAYRAAFKVTDLLYMVIIGGALGSSFIPVFIQVWDRDGAERAWRLASAVLTWALGLLAAASAVLWVFAPTITVWLYAGPGFDAELLGLTTALIRLFLFSPLLLGLGGLAMAVINAHERFALPALAPAIYNLGIIAGAVVLAPSIGIWGLAWGVVFGALFYLLLQLPGLWQLGMRLQLTHGRDMVELGTIAGQMAPRVFGQAASHISIVITAVLTAQLAQGAERLAGLEYAYQLMLLPYGIFSLSLSTVAFPRLARLFAEGSHDELIQRVRRTFSTILLLTMPSAVVLIILGVPIVRLLLQRGEFDTQSLMYTVVPLFGYATALPAFACSEILIRTFYAMQETRTPVLIGLFQVMANLALSSLVLWLGGGVGLLALAFSIANNLEALLLFLALQRWLPAIWRDAMLWRSIRATVIATALLAVLLWATLHGSVIWLPFLSAQGLYAWQQHLFPLVIWLILVGLLGGAFYLALAALAGSNDARALWHKLISIRTE